MTDTVEQIQPVVETAPVETVTAPALAAPEAIVEVQVVAPAPEVPEVKEAPVEAPKEATTLIAKELDKTEPKVEPKVETVEPEKAVEEKTETPEVVEPSEIVPPTYETFKLPEGAEVDPERLTEFTGILADLETKSKAGHEFVQEFGQKAIDFHIAEVQKVVENINKSQLETWEKTVDGWRESTIADPEIGGNRIQTTLDSANKFIRTHGGTPEQQKEVRDLMETTGLGNNPVMLRLLSAAGRAMSEGTPVPAIKPAAAPKSKTTALYGRKR